MSSKHDIQYLKIAQIWAENSHAKRLKVGAIIVKDNTIIADGYNGQPKGFDNICEYEEIESYRLDSGEYATRIVEKTKATVLHAEANAITKLAQSNSSSKDATIYTLVSPCIECSKLIIQSGIKRVVYAEDYRLPEGIDLLRKAGIEVDKITI